MKSGRPGTAAVQALIPIYLLALHLVGDAQIKSYWLDQISLAGQSAHLFLQEQWDQIKQLAEKYAKAPKVFVLGTGPNLGPAEEASLKIIEMALQRGYDPTARRYDIIPQKVKYQGEG